MAEPITREISAGQAEPQAAKSPFSLLSLRDKIALVTGASSGIGKAISLTLAAEGAQVCLVGRNTESLEEVARAAHPHSPFSRVCRADLTRDEDIRSMAENLERNGGRLDVLVHSAGAIHHGDHADALVADLDAQYRANVRGPYYLTQELLPLLRRGPGQIVFINSSRGLQGRAHAGQYAATQHAMKAIADSLREEINGDGIRVLSVYLGRTATPRTEQLFRDEHKAYRPELLLQPEDVAAMVVHALKMPRTAEVTDMSIRALMKSY